MNGLEMKEEDELEGTHGVAGEALLRERFRTFTNAAGSLRGVARKLKRSTKAVTDYLDGRITDEIAKAGMDRDVRRLLSQKEDARFSSLKEICVSTEGARVIEECVRFALQESVMTLITAASGFGKTTKLRSLTRENEEILYLVLDVATRAPSSVLRRLADLVGGVSHGMATSDRLQIVAERVRRYFKVLIIDDCHFAAWESFEIFRYLHDCAGVGLVLAGQPRTVDAMMGRADRLLLFDQLLSRLAMRRHISRVTREDVRLIVESKVGPIDKASLDFLFQRAQGQGRFRTLTNLLRLASGAAEELRCSIGLEILKEAAQYLVF